MGYSWDLQPETLTPDFLAALIKWQSNGSRAVDIKLKRDSIEDRHCLTIWCFDYTVMGGRYISKMTDIPTTKDLAKMKQVSIEKQQAELQKQMEELS